MSRDAPVDELVRFVSRGLEALADANKAGPMAAYMKTDMPFYGVQTPRRAPLFKQAVRRFSLDDRTTWQTAVLALWALPHREEKYAALHIARSAPRFHTPEALPMCERLIREGAWWDLVDEVATHLLPAIQRDHRPLVRPVMDAWIDDDDLWIRRAAILSQMRLKAATDEDQLFGYCLRRAPEREFFIRKAIGWALRDYSYAAPESVREFLLTQREELSGLSFREGKKQLVRLGLMD